MSKLEDLSVAQMRKAIREVNKVVKIKDYARKKKDELIKMLRKHPMVKIEEGRSDGRVLFKVAGETLSSQSKITKKLQVTKASGAKSEMKLRQKPRKRKKKAPPKDEEKPMTVQERQEAAKKKKAKERRERVKGKLKDRGVLKQK